MWRVCGVLILFLLPACARSQQVCPWLTQGTAAALMAGDVRASVHVSAGEGTCEFLRTADDDDNRAAVGEGLLLGIAVSRQLPRECATGEPLKGVGQDSVFCAEDADGKHQQMIRGRVRNTYFLLTLTSKATRTTNEAVLRRTLDQAAEEVAGNLF